MRIAILGAGAWGSALAISLAANHRIAMWTRDAEARAKLSRDRLSRYLPFAIPQNVAIADSLEEASRSADLVIVATATSGLRPVAAALARAGETPRLLWACKGFDAESRRLPHEIMAEVLPRARDVGALSGPSFADEVARGLPTAVVVASGAPEFAQSTAVALNTPRLRFYTSADVKGVELGGGLKNVIAIAAGISDGLELGRNARAALVTRGLAEMVRLGVALGGQAETFMGLTGLGDLVLTCTGDLSRNRAVGLGLARGQPLQEVLIQLGHVAEGVHSARAAREHARGCGVEMPITEAVCAVLFEGASPRDAVQKLLARDPRPEWAPGAGTGSAQ
ncbi:MAG TPA: NAD(P)H-dependent glycerol-3-phosphate dehydrogenase [Usitatibacter sp.]|nr:NAD(P)H-dependent glycerol-3-phosphate dehydrogenase [Usitatibacter sp.]